MKQYTKTIGVLTAIGFLIINAAGYYIFNTMFSSLVNQQKERFHEESRAKINILNERLKNLTQSFNSFSQLPSFRSIRFYKLTLNKLAVDENIRQLELYFFDILKSNRYLTQVRFIDKRGNEIFKIDKQSIHNDLLKNTSFDFNPTNGTDEFYITTLLDKKSYIKHIPEDKIAAMIDSGKFTPTTDFSLIKNID